MLLLRAWLNGENNRKNDFFIDLECLYLDQNWLLYDTEFNFSMEV